MKYNSSLRSILFSLIPEHSWKEERFNHLPRGYWDSKENRRKFMDEVGLKIGVKENNLSPWYTATLDVIISNGGGRLLLGAYGGSLKDLLKDIYPEHIWDPLKFPHRPRNFWKDPKNVKEFLEIVGQKNGISTDRLEGWYNLTVHQVRRHHGGKALLNNYKNSLYVILSSIYPEHDWDPLKFPRRPRDALMRSQTFPPRVDTLV